MGPLNIMTRLYSAAKTAEKKNKKDIVIILKNQVGIWVSIH